MDSKRVEQYEIDRIKEIQLNMLEEIDSFCRTNDIKYCLAYGSLIGAIRHNGYIPWDDDVDIWMTRDNFEKFRESYKSDDNKLCTMSNTLNYPFYMAKVINKNTKLIENGVKHLSFDYGVYVDIFVLDVLPNNKIIQEIKLARNYFLYCLLRIKFSSSNNILYKMIKKTINPSKIEKKQKKLWEKTSGLLYKDDATLYIFGKNKINKRYKFNISWFDNTIDHKFENLTCMIPEKYDKILKQCYGDYMKLPPEDQREVHNYIAFEEIEQGER